MTDTTNNKKEYLETKVKPILDELVFQLLCEGPENPASYMIDWLKKTGGYTSNGLTLKEKEELERLRKDIICYRKKILLKKEVMIIILKIVKIQTRMNFMILHKNRKKRVK